MNIIEERLDKSHDQQFIRPNHTFYIKHMHEYVDVWYDKIFLFCERLLQIALRLFSIITLT